MKVFVFLNLCNKEQLCRCFDSLCLCSILILVQSAVWGGFSLLIFQTVNCSWVAWFQLSDKLALVLLCCHSPPAPGALCVTWNLQCVKLNCSCETFYRNQHGLQGWKEMRLEEFTTCFIPLPSSHSVQISSPVVFLVLLTFTGIHVNSISKAAQ